MQDLDRTILRTLAPAKINLTLEVLGKRPDGYHNLVSIVQTIDLVDDIFIMPSHKKEIRFLDHNGNTLPTPRNELIDQAWTALSSVYNIDECAAIIVVKRIPEAAGLGGGSSDAAAFLRLASHWWNIGLENNQYTDKFLKIASKIGSDVSLFLTGGTMLIANRGDQITPLDGKINTREPLVAALFLPKIPHLKEKTATMFAGLQPSHYSDGTRTKQFFDKLSHGASVPNALLSAQPINTFTEIADNILVGLKSARDQLHEKFGRTPLLTGAGPCLFIPGEQQVLIESIASLADKYEGLWLVKGLPDNLTQNVWETNQKSVP